MEHLIDANLLKKRVEVYLIGVGGNGAQWRVVSRGSISR